MFRSLKILLLVLILGSNAFAEMQTNKTAMSDSKEIRKVLAPLLEHAEKSTLGKLHLEIRKHASEKLVQAGFAFNREYLLVTTTTYTNPEYTTKTEEISLTEEFKDSEGTRYNLITTLRVHFTNCQVKCEFTEVEVQDVNLGINRFSNRGSSSSAGGR